MRFSTTVALLASAAVASAADIQVKVGDANSLTFSPSSVTAASGDTINFTFLSKNHSVTQSTFASPCQVMTTPKAGIDSGFQAVPTGATKLPQWSFTLDDASAAAPLWFFCAQTNPVVHCNQGMVFAVNPTQAKSFDAFQAAAKGVAATDPATNSTSPSSGGAAPNGSATTPAAPTQSGMSTVIGSPPASTGSPTDSASTTNGTGAASNNNSGALRMSGNAAGILAVVGLIAGLIL